MVTSTPKARMRKTREFSAHHRHLGIASAALIEATKFGDQSDGCWTAIISAALAAEALSNHIGRLVVPNFFDDYGKLTPDAKLRHSLAVLGQVVDRADAPWTVLRDIAAVRNMMAHAKPEDIDVNVYLTQKELEMIPTAPLSKLEERITVENAERAVNAVQHVKQILLKTLPEKLHQGIIGDSWYMGP